jgi:hypothetical protein
MSANAKQAVFDVLVNWMKWNGPRSPLDARQDASDVCDRLERASLLASPEMVEAAEACRAFYRLVDAWGPRDLVAIRRAGAALLAAERPKGPWRVDPHADNIGSGALNRAVHSDGRSVRFYKDEMADPIACAAFVAEQNRIANGS